MHRTALEPAQLDQSIQTALIRTTPQCSSLFILPLICHSGTLIISPFAFGVRVRHLKEISIGI